MVLSLLLSLFAATDSESQLRARVDLHSRELLVRGERILNWLEDTYARKASGLAGPAPVPPDVGASLAARERPPVPCIPGLEFTQPGRGWETVDLFGVARAPVPYNVFRARLAEENRTGEEVVCASR